MDNSTDDAPPALAGEGPSPDDSASRSRPLQALRDARATYRALSELLGAEVRALSRKVRGKGFEEAQKLVQAHQKSLSQLMEFEARVEKLIVERIGRGRGDLDLAAARGEILGKLARLASRLGAGGADRGPDAERAACV